MNLLFFNRASKLLKRLLLIVGLPIISIVVLIEVINYVGYRRDYLNSVEQKQFELSEQIKTYYELQTRSLGMIEEQMNVRLKDLSSQIVSAVDTAQNFSRIDLDRIRRILRMDQRLEDIYIIDSKGVVVRNGAAT